MIADGCDDQDLIFFNSHRPSSVDAVSIRLGRAMPETIRPRAGCTLRYEDFTENSSR
jgi:hypothetical protein